MANPMTEDQEDLFTNIFHDTVNLVEALKDEADANKGRLPCREFSIVLTKLEEAEMWLRRGFEEMEYEVPEPDEGDDEDDDGDDEGDDASEEEESPPEDAKDEEE